MVSCIREELLFMESQGLENRCLLSWSLKSGQKKEELFLYQDHHDVGFASVVEEVLSGVDVALRRGD